MLYSTNMEALGYNFLLVLYILLCSQN